MWLNKSRKYKGYLRDASNVYWLKVIFTHLKTHMSCFSFPRQWTNFCYLSPCLGTLAVYALHVIEEINGIQLKSIFLKWKFLSFSLTTKLWLWSLSIAYNYNSIIVNVLVTFQVTVDNTLNISLQLDRIGSDRVDVSYLVRVSSLCGSCRLW